LNGGACDANGKPNILVIWGDDIGISNLSCYSDGMMGYRCQGTLRTWAEPFTPLRVPKLFNLRTDPFEYADITSNTYYDWFLRRDFFVFYATAMASAILDTFKEFPPRHPPASFSVDQIVKKLENFLAAD
jgi:hypothetical protein